MSLGHVSNQADGMRFNPPPDRESMFEAFIQRNPQVKYIWLQFQSTTGTTRCRMIPIKAFRRQLSREQFPGVTMALPRLLANEWPSEGCVPVGEFQLDPDMTSICLIKGIDSPSATIQTWWTIISQETRLHWTHCPRWTLERQVHKIANEFGLSVLIGFEVEVVFVRPIKDNGEVVRYDPLTSVHSWSNMTYEQTDALPLIEEIVDTLADLNIELDQFHAEAAPGQWEFPLPPASPIQAIDMLYKARETIGNLAKKHGLKATLYPRPFANAPGSASHVHFSLNGNDEQVRECSDSFLAGILYHLPSIVAFSLPLQESYARVAPGVWGGGEWIAWGTQNREVPVRKCGPAHWEFKAIDGIGNMYLSMAALLAAGVHGLRTTRALTHKDCPVDASSSLTGDERRSFGITDRLPNTLDKSLAHLRGNVALRVLLGNDIVQDYLAVKSAEMTFLDSMDENGRKLWLMNRW